ncbi:MAG: hypothetical protein Tsb002_05910 [Wenzhouxiangellaceae bacterium]
MSKLTNRFDRLIHRLDRLIFALIVAAWLLPVTGHADSQLLGQPARNWAVSEWINSEPLELDQLRGKVVLVRWWTAPDCPFCRASAAALNEWHQRYSDHGLQVIGFYHHKSRSPLSLEQVREYTRVFGFQFAVAIDPQWRTLREWWLDTGQRNWTSVSFLLDQEGVIRYIHPGGSYVKGDPDYRAMEQMIDLLLAESRQ